MPVRTGNITDTTVGGRINSALKILYRSLFCTDECRTSGAYVVEVTAGLGPAAVGALIEQDGAKPLF